MSTISRGLARVIPFVVVLALGITGAHAANGKPDALLGLYPMGPLQPPMTGVAEMQAIDRWLGVPGLRLGIAGDFMDPEFPNPDYNVYFDLQGAWNAGYIPFVNLTFYSNGGRSATAIANGAADAGIRAWAHEYAKWTNGGQRRAFLAPMPEMNGDWVPYHVGGPGAFQAAYRRVHAIFEDELNAAGVPLTAISWVFAPNGASPPGTEFELYYPGPDAVDIVGFSAYNYGGCAGDQPWFVWDTFDIAIKPFLDRMRAMAPNKPIFLAQTGSLDRPAHGVGDKDSWLDDAYTKLSAYPGLRAVIYYNVHFTNSAMANCPDADFRVYNPSTGQWQGFRNALARPGMNFGYYAPGGPEVANMIFARPQQLFGDVAPNHPWLGPDAGADLSSWILKLYASGVTGGCSQSPLLFCPDGIVTRKQMAKFLLLGAHGAHYVPPPAAGIFGDVWVGDQFAGFIEQLAAEGITGGCSQSPLFYCPDQPVTRAQMAKFLLKAKNGRDYTPPPPTGIFGDVPLDHPLAAYIEALAAANITGGCGPGLYCPNSAVTRAQMAVFLVKTFGL